MLKKVYGEIILKEGCILYHTSEDILKYRKDKPMLFCTFHPNEYVTPLDNVAYIKLKRDVSLFFMIDDINKTRIYSALNTLIDHPQADLIKRRNIELGEMTKHIKNNKFDGWFSSIENKCGVEIALVNNKNLFENDNSTINYEICTIRNPVILNINERFKDIIEKYISLRTNKKVYNKCAFQIILTNAILNYHKGEYQKLSWDNVLKK